MTTRIAQLVIIAECAVITSRADLHPAIEVIEEAVFRCHGLCLRYMLSY